MLSASLTNCRNNLLILVRTVNCTYFFLHGMGDVLVKNHISSLAHTIYTDWLGNHVVRCSPPGLGSLALNTSDAEAEADLFQWKRKRKQLNLTASAS